MKRIWIRISLWRPLWFFRVYRRLVEAKRADKALARAQEQARESKDRTLADREIGRQVRALKRALLDEEWQELMNKRVTALEEQNKIWESEDNRLWNAWGDSQRRLEKLEPPTPSPATASPTTDCPSGALGPEFIARQSRQFSPLAQPTTTDGLAEAWSASADPSDAPK